MITSTSRPALVAAILWFGLLVLLAGAATPGYSQATQAISELAAPDAPYVWLVRFGGFIPLGSILVLYAFAFARLNEAALPKMLVSALVWLTGAAVIVAGVFPTDPGGQRNSLSGIIHAAAGLTLLIVSSATPFLALFLLSGRRSRRSAYALYSVLTGFALTGLFLMMPNGILPGLVELHRKILGNLFPAWYQLHGIVQRTFMAVYFVWLGSFVHLRFHEVY